MSDLTGDGFKHARLMNIVETHPYYLHFMVYRGDLALIRQFFALNPINLPEILNEKDHRGNTVLTLAIKLSHFAPDFYSIIRLLLSKGADPKQKDAYGWSALDEAVSKGDRDLVGLLFDSLHAKKCKNGNLRRQKQFLR
jgi:ankyrin repeat protein